MSTQPRRFVRRLITALALALCASGAVTVQHVPQAHAAICWSGGDGVYPC